MRSIRSLLWVGSGRGLAASGMTEAPELDVTWVPNVAEALALPRVHFDGVLLETEDGEHLEEPLPRLAAAMPEAPILVCLPGDASDGDREERMLALGARALLLIEPGRVGPGLVSAVGDCLDALLAAEKEAALAGSSPVATDESIGGDTVGTEPALDAVASPDAAPLPPGRKRPPVGRVDAPRASGRARTGDAPTDAWPGARVVGVSEAMQKVVELVELAAESPSTVLLTGETGVGKEVVARELHRRSGRAEESFLAINCAAFPETLLESELFGHVKGAFTGADRAKRGLVEEAGRGTLFLDEIAEMALPLQAKLLRVLQEREVRPVGGARIVRVECRILAATNRVLAEEVEGGRFREDLFYRLNVFPIRIPPLRERRRDVLPLTRLSRCTDRARASPIAPSSALAQLLESYAWPGNVRELENEILRMLMMTPNGQLLTPKALSPKITEILEPIGHAARPDETLREALERVEAWMIRRALANNGGRKARTARKLGLTREGLYKKLKRLGID
ncbi:MAG: sigma 54-interacting transcriptional regulator [Planctomycetota bacterium]